MEVTAEVVALDSLGGGDLGERLEHLLLRIRLAVGESVDERLERDDFDTGDFHSWSFLVQRLPTDEASRGQGVVAGGWVGKRWVDFTAGEVQDFDLSGVVSADVRNIPWKRRS